MIAICISTVVCSIAEHFCGEKNKTVLFAAALFSVICVLGPLRELSINTDLSSAGSGSYGTYISSATDVTVEESYATGIRKDVESILIAAGIYYEKVSVSVDYRVDDGIYINEITVCSDRESVERIAAVLSEKLSVDPAIIAVTGELDE